MEQPAQITIVEGPPPDFELVYDNWPIRLIESPEMYMVAYCQTRAFDAPKLVARCRRAWQEYNPIFLDHPNPFGTRTQVEIVAAQADRVPEGDILNLWVKVPVAE